MRFTIGEFSRMTFLSIKSLRLYHEKEILVPAEVDQFTGYRYYSDKDYETARVISILKAYDFTLAEIKEILDECREEADLLGHLAAKLLDVKTKIRRYQEISRSIERTIFPNPIL
jgi:DNA-binding transcriptional MerR regulator